MRVKRDYYATVSEIKVGVSETIKATPVSGLYVSNMGRVFGEDVKGIYEIFPYVNKYKSTAKNGKKYNTTHFGYYKFHYKGKMRTVHTLVAHTFVPGFLPGLCAHHSNGNSLDNRASNLEWTTRSENTTRYWEDMDEETRKAFSEHYGECVKKAHTEGKYKKHLTNLHKKGE